MVLRLWMYLPNNLITMHTGYIILHCGNCTWIVGLCTQHGDKAIIYPIDLAMMHA